MDAVDNLDGRISISFVDTSTLRLCSGIGVRILE